MTDIAADKATIRELVENWAVYRDARLWDRFRAVWHAEGRMMATWFQGSFEEFIKVNEEGWERGVRILHFLGGSAIEQKEFELAIKLLDAVIELKPNYTEAWNRRATVYYLQKDYGRALSDIREVLAREPRHFGALSGLGLILQEIGDEKHALEVFRRALAIHPHLERIPDLVKKLSEKLDGRDI